LLDSLLKRLNMSDLTDDALILRLRCELKAANEKISELERRLKQATMFGDVLLKRNRALLTKNDDLKGEKSDELQNVIISSEVLNGDIMLEVVEEVVSTVERDEGADGMQEHTYSQNIDNMEFDGAAEVPATSFHQQSEKFESADKLKVKRGRPKSRFDENVCFLCEFKTHDKLDFRDHLLEEHGLGKGRYPCNMCGFVGYSLKDLRKHFICKGVHGHECGNCNMSFASLIALTEHQKSRHKHLTYKCDSCENFSVGSRHDLQKHINHLHKGVYACDECYYTAKNDSFLSLT